MGPHLGRRARLAGQGGVRSEDLDASPEKVAELESERQTLYDAALAAADVLSAARVAAAADLGARVTEELGSLAMLGASLEVRVTPRDKADDPLGPYGRDDIAFLFTPFEGGRRSCRWAKALRAVN